MHLVFMSACLQDFHRRLKHNLSSKVKISGTRTPSGKPCFSKLKYHQFLYKTSNLYVLSVNETSKSQLGTKNVRYGETFKASKKTCQVTHILMTMRAKNLFATILVKYINTILVTILTEPDFSLQNQIQASQYDFCSLF